jgi:hypothetical protein
LYQWFDVTLEQDVTSPDAAGGGVTEVYAAYPGEQLDNSGGGTGVFLRKLSPIVVPDNETDGLAQDSSEQNSVSTPEQILRTWNEQYIASADRMINRLKSKLV